MSNFNRIVLIRQFPRHEEAQAAAAFTPGHLLERTSAGKVQKHSVEGGRAERLFAVEDALQGRTIDDAYALNELAMLHLASPGDEVYAFLKAGEDVDIGAKLISAGDGTLIAAGSAGTGVTVADVIAEASEALDLSGTGDVDTRLRVRVMA